MKLIREGEMIWKPSSEHISNSIMTQYISWLKRNKGVTFTDYTQLWKWSVEELEQFWQSIWEFCGVKASNSYHTVLEERKMPGAKWFNGATLNFSENVFLNYVENKTAIYFRSEHKSKTEISWKELRESVSSVAYSLKKMGVKRGDRVVGYMPNIPETVIAFLATVSIGAIWSCCSPDFGARSVLDRLKQIDPIVLIAADGYHYNGKVYDKTSVVKDLKKEIQSLKHTVLVPYVEQGTVEGSVPWSELISEQSELSFESVPFDYPLWVVYSSGTTGVPKPIVHGHGGIIVEYLKTFMIQNNITPKDKVFWFTTTGWVMWNILIGSLLTGSSIVLYDGSPSYPNMEILWGMAEEIGVTFFGTSAPFIHNSMKMNVSPKEKYNLSSLKSLCSTGAPLSNDGYNWVYENVSKEIWLSSSSGGTDICSGFVGGISTLPVRVGEIQARSLGVHAEAFDEQGNALINEVGELVITKPMPSMPLYFWNDKDNKRYLDSYFDTYPDVWKQGDWIKIDEKGSSIIYGRSDSTINRSGVRIGTSDLYRVVEAIDEVMESLIIDMEVLGRDSLLLLFIVLRPGNKLSNDLENKIKEMIKSNISPRFVPDKIYETKEIPKTLNGKKMEVPIRKMLLGFDFNKVVNPDSMSNPDSLYFFKELSKSLNTSSEKTLF